MSKHQTLSGWYFLMITTRTRVSEYLQWRYTTCITIWSIPKPFCSSFRTCLTLLERKHQVDLRLPDDTYSLIYLRWIFLDMQLIILMNFSLSTSSDSYRSSSSTRWQHAHRMTVRIICKCLCPRSWCLINWWYSNDSHLLRVQLMVTNSFPDWSSDINYLFSLTLI